jgi:transcriptional regulator with XRE-family HTH domain
VEKRKDPFGERLKATRKARKLSVPEVSVLLDIPQDRIYKWEHGASPKYEDRVKVEKWLNGESGDLREIGRSSEKDKFLSGEIKLSAQEYVNELKKDKVRLEKLIEDSQRIIDTNLTAMMTLLSTLHRHDLSFHEVMLEALARLEKRKNPRALIEEAHIRDTARMVEESAIDRLSSVGK